ncbi:MAG: alpha-hydroxy-acid oxidizing protein [Acidobacteriia bacterium]|nr:alpha-hydroxy-acid oxidizing protein [Terriglobia bacterium]
MTPDRRRFLQFLAASPLLPHLRAQQSPKADDALSVMDFEAAAKRALPPAHWGYMASGVDDDFTLRANHEAFQHYRLRVRRLVDVSQPDLRTEIFGQTWESPIFICPCGAQRAFHNDGELATARAAKTKQTQMILSTQTSVPIEDVNKAYGKPVWFQLYTTSRWDATEKLVKRAEDSGSPVLVFTVDQQAGRNTETQARIRPQDTRNCGACHEGGGPATFSQQGKPMYAGIDTNGIGLVDPALTWTAVDRLKKFTRMKVVLKGIVTREDAMLARQHGADGIIVSNHGGRAEESGLATIDCLAEVVDGAGTIPVLLDGGVRRGTDVYKALALGARGVGIGRPYLWGLSAFGQPGVERVLDILHGELHLIMRQCGTPAIQQITKSAVQRA